MHPAIIYKSKIYDVLAFFLILFSMLPYLKTSPLSTDIQPHIILIFFLYFIADISMLENKFLIKRYNSYAIILISCIFVLLLGLSAEIFDYFRIIFFFFSFFLLIKVYENSSGAINAAVSISIIIYFIGAVSQIIFGIAVLDPFVSNLRFSDSRGLTSFTSEPSFFGLISLVQILILEIIHKKKFRFFQGIALVNLFLSGSLFVILPAIIIFILYFVRTKYALAYITIFALVGIGILSIISATYPELRAVKLMDTLLTNPELLLNDVSMLNRLLRSFTPVYLSFIDYLQLHDFIHIEEHLSGVVDYFDKSEYLSVERLSNVTTYLVYPFGYFGILIIVYFLYKLYKFKVPIFLFFAIIYYASANITILTPYVTILFVITYVHFKNNNNFCSLNSN